MITIIYCSQQNMQNSNIILIYNENEYWNDKNDDYYLSNYQINDWIWIPISDFVAHNHYADFEIILSDFWNNLPF